MSFSVVRCHFRGVDLPQLHSANSWFTEASKAIVMCWDGVQKSLFFWDLLWADLFYWSFEFLPKLHMVPLQLKLVCSQNRTKHPMDPPEETTAAVPKECPNGPGPVTLRPCGPAALCLTQIDILPAEAEGRGHGCSNPTWWHDSCCAWVVVVPTKLEKDPRKTGEGCLKYHGHHRPNSTRWRFLRGGCRMGGITSLGFSRTILVDVLKSAHHF